MPLKPIGPTGTFSQGKLGPTDDGDLQIGVAQDSQGNVILNFGTNVSWIGMPPDQAIQFAKLIMRRAGARKIEVIF